MTPAEPMFELRNLEVTAGDRQLLSGVNVTLGTGEWTAVTGQSGSGKSTLLKVLALLLRPSSGCILIRGGQPDHRTVTALRRKMPLTLQEPVLLGQTAREDLTEAFSFDSAEGAAPPDEERMTELLATVELPRDILDQSTGRLSGGEKQRVAIARALALAPQALLLDEPTSALDLVTAERVFDNIARDFPGLGLVLVTHSKPLIDRTTAQLLLRGGKLVEVTRGLSDSALRQFLEERP